MPVRPWVPTDLASGILEGWWYLRNPFKQAGDDGRDGEQLAFINGTISVWKDASGKGRNCSSPSSSSRPSYSSDGLGSDNPGISFNGSSNLFRCTIEPATGTTPLKRFGALAVCVSGSVQTANTKRIVSLVPRTGTDTADGTIPLAYGTNSGTSTTLYTQNRAVVSGSTAPGTGLNIAYGGPTSSTQIGIKLNGASAVNVSNNVPIAIERMGVGAQFTDSVYTQFVLGDLVLTSGDVSASDIALLEGYAAWNANNPTRLVSGHPWRSTRPMIDADYPETVPLPQVFHRRRLVGVN